jgi:glycosyltransferase involved in cell wall biosynthesis
MRVSFILTVLNEAESLPRLLDSLVAQTRAPDEVIICDGGSTDGTLRLLEREERLPLRVIQRPGTNISQGRNAAIDAASGDIVAVTDAGVRLSPRWLEKIVAPFEDPDVHTVAGTFRLDPHTLFEIAMGATVIPEVHELADMERYPPSSRSFAFRKTAWQAVGGYPEWIDYCEDVVFDLRLRDQFGMHAFAPKALVHFRPRHSLRDYWRQYYQYARGDGKADLCLWQHLVRYAAYLGGLALIVGGGFARWWPLPAIGLFLLLGVVVGRSRTPYRRLARTWRDLPFAQKLQAVLWVPVIRVVGDVAKMLGYPAGVWWRWHHRAQVPDWRRL